MAAGDTGSVRSGGERSADTWSKREKAAEDMYIKDREKQIMQILKERIREQQLQIDRDQKLLNEMEDQYGHHAERV